MSKEEFLKIQTCVLKVNIHCDGCKDKVKKILQKIEGVYTVKIDSEQGKVSVSGNIDPSKIIKKLIKNGKHAELWGASKCNNNPHNFANQFKNLQMDNNGKGGNNKGNAQKGGGGGGSGGGGHPKGVPAPNMNMMNPQLQQQLQMMKALQDMKMAPKGQNNHNNQKSVKFDLPEDDDFSEDDLDDEWDDDDDDYDDNEFDDAVRDKMKAAAMMGGGRGGAPMPMPNPLMQNMMNAGKGGGNIPIQMMNHGGGGSGNGSKKGGNGNNNGGNQNQGGGGKGGKNGGNANGGQNQNGNNGHKFNPNNGAKKGGMNDGPHGMMMMPNMMAGAGMNGGQMGGQMNNLGAVRGLPASAMTAAGGGGRPGGVGGAGYIQGDHMPGNPYQQQQLAAMMLNQQRANGNERFQPMMYARPPPAVNYIPPYPPYPYPPPPGTRLDEYAMFSDENTSSCTVM